MSNCQQCGKPNPPSKGNRRRKFCSKKCGKLNHYNRYKAEGRYSYYTKKNPDWGKKTREDNERRQKNQEEWDKWSAIWLTRKQVAELYVEALRLHWDRKWDEALASLTRGLELDANDGPSTMLRERILVYKETPPAEGWQGRD